MPIEYTYLVISKLMKKPRVSQFPKDLCEKIREIIYGEGQKVYLTYMHVFCVYFFFYHCLILVFKIIRLQEYRFTLTYLCI